MHHLRRLNAPKSWPIKRKSNKYLKRPNPGAHPIKLGIPMTILLRDILEVAKSNKEVKKILYNKEILVDQRRVKDPKFIVGLFDTITLLKDNYRVMIGKNKKLSVIEIKGEESKLKLSKVTGKTKIKGKTQLNLFDSRNILIDKDDYKTADSVLIDLPKQTIKEHIKFDKGVSVVLTGGKHMGDQGTIEDISSNKIIYKNKEGEKIETLKKYAFVVGKQKPLIKIEWIKWEMFGLRKSH